jgi:hypothetical protein
VLGERKIAQHKKSFQTGKGSMSVGASVGWVVKETVMVGVNRLLCTALAVVGCLAAVEFAGPYLECPHTGAKWNAGRGAADPGVEWKMAILRQRLAAKTRVIDQVAARQMDLLEAAAWFHHFNENPPDCPGEVIRGWPEAGPEEKLCRQVIDWARLQKIRFGSEGEADELTNRLEQQLADALAQPGGLVLPPW